MTVLSPDPSMTGDARDVFTQTLLSYGFTQAQIDELIPQIVQWQTIYTPAEIVRNMLPTTDVYKQRFSANDARIKAGLTPLPPDQYIATEEAYMQVMRAAGLPTGFYDSQDDFTKFLANDVSVTELQSRVSAAQKAIDNSDPYYTQALQEMYGMSTGDMIAHLLDPERAAPLLEKQARAVEYGAAAARQGLGIDTSAFEQYAAGVGTGVGAEAGMAAVAEMAPGLTGLAGISGEEYGQQTAQEEVFGGLASAKRARQRLIQQEQDRFTGRSSVAPGSLRGGIEGAF